MTHRRAVRPTQPPGSAPFAPAQCRPLTPQFGSGFIEERDATLNVRGMNGRRKSIEQFAEATFVFMQPITTPRSHTVPLDDHLPVMRALDGEREVWLEVYRRLSQSQLPEKIPLGSMSASGRRCNAGFAVASRARPRLRDINENCGAGVRLRARSGGSIPARGRRKGLAWCGREDSNFHGVSPTSTSSLRVYHSATTARAGGGGIADD
jgi:hypothetical protein